MVKVIKKIFDFVFILIIILLVGYFALRNIGILEIYKVETGSMEHGIHIGDYVLICRKNEYVVGDIVTYSLKCIYKQKEVYNKEKIKSDLDCSLDEVHMLEIEHRILENIKIGEKSIVTVVPEYMTAKNKLFLEKYIK